MNATHTLRDECLPCRVGFTWFGVRRQLSGSYQHEVAATFGAEDDSVSGSKKIIDTKHPAFKALTALRGEVRKYWQAMTLPFPEPKIRLLRRVSLDEFQRAMEEFQGKIQAGARELDTYADSIQQERQRVLGRLYDPSDYPSSFANAFAVEWDYPSIEVPSYLRDLSPSVYEAERQRAAAQLDESVRLTEEAFREQLGELVRHLASRLTDGAEGRKVLRDSAVTNLREFFERFRTLNLHSSAELDTLVQQAEGLLGGVDPEALRREPETRESIRQGMEAVAQALDAQVITAPRRRIVLPPVAPVAPAVPVAPPPSPGLFSVPSIPATPEVSLVQ